MSFWLTPKQIRRRSEVARIRANKRWEIERQRQAALAAKDPAFTGLKILRRVVVIDNEQAVREAVIYSTDSNRSAQRKINRVLYPL